MQLLPATSSIDLFANKQSSKNSSTLKSSDFTHTLASILQSSERSEALSSLSQSNESNAMKSKFSSLVNKASLSLSQKNGSTKATSELSSFVKKLSSHTSQKNDANMPSLSVLQGNESMEIDSNLASFIEEGRTKYTGIPADAPAYEKESGTISRDQIHLLRKNLKKKGAQSESIDCLNQLLASGTTLTIGNVFSALQGTARSTAELTDDERKAFRSIMGQLGVSSNETDTLLDASDKGDKKTVWNTLITKFQEKEGTTDINKSEMKAVLHSLDLSDETTSFIMKNFKENDRLSLDSEKISQLLASAEKEIVAREEAEQQTKSIMREAMLKSLEDDKKNKVTETVISTRGSRRQEQSESLMQESIRKKNGYANLVSTASGDDVSSNKADAADEEQVLADERSFYEKNIAIKEETTNQKQSFSKSKSSGTVDANIKRKETNKEKTSPSNLFSHIESNHLDGIQPEHNAKDLHALARQHKQEIFEQVESGFLQNKANGSHEITLSLAPSDLGKMNLILNVKEGEVRATIRTEREESAATISGQLAELKTALEEQGLKVVEIEVRTGLADNNAQSDQWQKQNEHNMMRENQERDRNRQLANLRRTTGDTSSSIMVTAEQRQPLMQTGLHIVA